MQTQSSIMAAHDSEKEAPGILGRQMSVIEANNELNAHPHQEDALNVLRTCAGNIGNNFSDLCSALDGLLRYGTEEDKTLVKSALSEIAKNPSALVANNVHRLQNEPLLRLMQNGDAADKAFAHMINEEIKVVLK